MTKIKSTRYGVIHYHAVCSKCGWTAAILTERCRTAQDVRNSVYKHVRETGHAVNIESGNSTKYERDEI